jgi:hypothetical protein
MQESNYYGSSMSSYRKLENTKLILRHSKAVDENVVGGRSRHVKAIFIENEAGERFKYPFIHLAGAKAMQRHVANGGTPFDQAGQTITTMSEHIIKLGSFKRHVGNNQNLTTEAVGILDRASSKLTQLRNTMEAIGKQKNYEAWMESLDSSPLVQVTELDETTLADFKSKFTISSFKDDLAQYFPLLNGIMHETSVVELEDLVGEAKETCTCDMEGGQDECPVHGEGNEEAKKEGAFEAFESWTDELDPFSPAKLVRESGDQTPEEKHETMKYIVDLNKAIKAGEVQPTPELEKEFENTLGYLGLPFDQITKAWERVTGQSKDTGLDPKYKKPAPPMDMGSEEGEDEVDPDVAKYKSMAKSGRVGQDQTGFGAGLDEESEAGPLPIKEIAEVVKSMFDPIAGAFPRGETGVATHIGVKYGDSACELAEKLCNYLIQKHSDNKQMEAIRRLSGLTS